jgi:hypothetical protein
MSDEAPAPEPIRCARCGFVGSPTAAAACPDCRELLGMLELLDGPCLISRAMPQCREEDA